MAADSAGAQQTTPDSLIEQCLSGDQAPWDLIVRQNWRKVFNVAYKFVGKHDEAEDLTQDIFLKIFKALGTFGYQASVRKNAAYLGDVPRTLGYVRDTFGRRPRFARLRSLLAPHLPELQA